MDYQNITYEIDDHVGIIRFSGEDKYHIYSTALENDLMEAWNDVTSHEQLRGLIFCGTPSAFLTGFDVRELNVHDPAWLTIRNQKTQEFFSRIQNAPFPTAAAIDGYATGSGLELALSCDFRYASSGASFAFPEVTMGILPSVGGTQRLSRLIGTEQAKKMIFTGQAVSAGEAADIGLVGYLTKEESAFPKALELMRTIAANAPLAVSYAKQCIDTGIELSMQQGMILEHNAIMVLCTTEDAAEGTEAFLNKRKPQFRGW